MHGEIVIEQINFGCKSIEKIQKILQINTQLEIKLVLVLN